MGGGGSSEAGRLVEAWWGKWSEEGGRHDQTKHYQAHLQLRHAQDKGFEAVRDQEDLPEDLLVHASDFGDRIIVNL